MRVEFVKIGLPIMVTVGAIDHPQGFKKVSRGFCFQHVSHVQPGISGISGISPWDRADSTTAR